MLNVLVSTAALMLMSPVAFAHAAHAAHAGHAGHGGTGFAVGIAHPVEGMDHFLAMIAVGLLAVRCASRSTVVANLTNNRQALWQIPATFMAAMILGGGLAWAGVPLPLAEWGIALSVLVFGVLVALGNAPRIWVANVVVALFALLHGHAHVAEMDGGNVAVYMGGFLVTTVALHAVGIGSGWMLSSALKQTPIRVAGSSVAAVSAVLFYGMVAG